MSISINDPLAALPYRPCAGVMLANAQNRIFVGQRIDSKSDAWQMPQGGIDDGEDALTAAVRELEEEAGIAGHLVEIIASSANEHQYDLPAHLLGKMWGGKYRGQRQRWYLARFLGQDSDINIATRHPEFNAWRWADVETLPDLIVPFKRQLYLDLVAEFGPMLRG